MNSVKEVYTETLGLEEVPHLQVPGRVAAIDFGTGFCSLAYTLAKDDVISNIPWPLSSSYSISAREPTALLLRKNEAGTFKVHKFGSPAQNEITRLSTEELRNYLYFECFKMNLFREDVSTIK